MKKKLNYWTQLFEDGTDDTKGADTKNTDTKNTDNSKDSKAGDDSKDGSKGDGKKENPKRSTPTRMLIESFKRGSRESVRRQTRPRSLRT